MNPLKRFANYREVILLDDYTFSGGGARPIYTYYRHKVNQGHSDILFLRLATRGSLFKVFLLLFFQKRIVVNGIAAFRHWSVYPVCFFKKNVIIFLHEAAPHVEPFKKNNSLKHILFSKLLRRRKVAFVSEWQQAYFQANYKLGKTKVLHNAMFFPRFSQNKGVNIVMVAYQTKNKNVDFFSKVADAAAEKKLPYQFHWIGGDGGEMNNLYHSPHVNWMGDQEQVLDLLNHFDVLFFPSQSDTFGLVVMEALYKGLRVVTYKENGLAPFIGTLRGCRVFAEFDAEAVLKDLAAVLKEEVDLNKHVALAEELCGVDNFEKRLRSFFQEK